jgi:LysM repeat protein
MTVLDERQLIRWNDVCARPASLPVRTRGHVRPYRSSPVRPDIAPLQYRGTGASRSQVVHARRPVSTAVTVALAGMAALITLWLGSLSHVSAGRAATPAVSSDQLAVVRVQAGETLQHLAGRVAPGAPVEQVVSRIRELNKLDSGAVDAGQTLIAPLG